ncbi:MAG: hypothetical protein ACI4AD_04830 [Roseburia sp.]
MRNKVTGYTGEEISKANKLIDLLDAIPENRREIVVLMALSYIRGMESSEEIGKYATAMK